LDENKIGSRKSEIGKGLEPGFTIIAGVDERSGAADAAGAGDW
jgi:hypothetical protein